MATLLHQARLDAILHELLDARSTRVIDMGCGAGELLQHLSAYAQFERLVGIDIDVRALADARSTLGLDWLSTDRRLQVRLGSFEDIDPDLAGFDAAVLLETIEHVDPGRLSRVERTVFTGLRPRTVLITTPNEEYNVLHGMRPGERRHPDHRFEWTRAQFRLWSGGVAQRNGYVVSFSDVGEIDPLRGASTQLARFTLSAA